MENLLYLQASPRRDRSKSIAVADAFVDACRTHQPQLGVTPLNVFEEDLPAFDGAALEAKYAILHGQGVQAAQSQAWGRIEAVIETFCQAGGYVLAVPMWNFGIPYRLKQYLDLLIQPGYTFDFDPASGYSGRVMGKPACVVYARGGAYPPASAMAGLDLQRPYIEQVLRFIGFERIDSVIVEPTLHGTQADQDAVLEEAIAGARTIAQQWMGH